MRAMLPTTGYDVEHWLRRVASFLSVVPLMKKIILKCMILQYDNMRKNIRFLL